MEVQFRPECGKFTDFLLVKINSLHDGDTPEARKNQVDVTLALGRVPHQVVMTQYSYPSPTHADAQKDEKMSDLCPSIDRSYFLKDNSHWIHILFLCVKKKL